MPTKKQQLGAWGENAAASYLAKKGYQILNRHYTSRFGEIDIIAKDKDQLVFVEVKTRDNKDWGLPEDSVTKNKVEKIKKAIFAYVSQNNINDFRLDVVAIEKDPLKSSYKLRHHQAISNIHGF